MQVLGSGALPRFHDGERGERYCLGATFDSTAGVGTVSSRNARGRKPGSFGSNMAGLNRLRKSTMDGVETGFSQNGAGQYFGVNRESIHVDVRTAGGVCYLLWGEPGFSSIGGWVFGVGSYACTRRDLKSRPGTQPGQELKARS
jgi:hypothetical protein